MTKAYIWLTIVIFLAGIVGRAFDQYLPLCDQTCKYVALALSAAMIAWGLILVLND